MITNNEFDDWGQAPQSSENPDGQGGGVDLMQVAMRRKGLIALGVFVGLCLGLLYFARATPKYESSAILSIIDKSPPAVSGGMQDAFVIQTPAEVHSTRITTQQIILDALELPTADGGPIKSLPSLQGQENKVRTIFDGLTVQPVQEGSEDIALAYRGTNADDCQEILQAMMQSYENFLQEGRKERGTEVKKWITEEYHERLAQYNTRKEEYRKWRENSDLFIRDDNGMNVHQQRLMNIESDMYEQESRNLDLRLQIADIKANIKEGMPARAVLSLARDRHQDSLDDEKYFDRTIQTETIRQLLIRENNSEQRIVPLLMQDEELKRRFGEDHPARQSLQRQFEIAANARENHSKLVDGKELIDDPKKTVRAIESLHAKLQQELLAGQKKVELFQARIKQEAALGKKMAQDSFRNMSDQEEIQLLKDAYLLVQDKVREVTMADAFGGDDKFLITQLQKAGIGEQVEPSLAKSLAAGSMLGFLAGFGLGYLVEMFDKTFRDPQEVSKLLQLPMIGHIPEITTEAIEGSTISEVLVAYHQPKSPLAENFRAIRTALYFSTAGQQTRVIQTTSPVPGDGKSTLTANLAVTIAQSNKSVLLLDADFRRPTMHKLFGATNQVGLATVISGDAEPAQAIQKTEVPNLHIMACGRRPSNPSELLTSPNFADLLQVLQDEYDFVLIDTPPVLAVTDPGIVSARVDGVIMALRIRKNGRPGAVRARKILADLDAPMLGIVVNGIDHRSGSYGYYSNYRKGYGYNYTYKYGYGQDQTEQEIGKYYEEPPKSEDAAKLEEAR